MRNRILVVGFLLGSFVSFGQSDDPCGAPALTVNATCTFGTFTTTGATETAGPPAPGCGNFQGGDVWFSLVVPANGNVQIDSDDTDFTDSGMAAYSGPCGSLTLIECDDDDSNNGAMSYLNLSGLTAGSTIYIRFWEYGNDASGNFQICANEFTPPPPPANDDCAGAISLTVNPDVSCAAVTSGTIAGATQSSQSDTDCAGTEDDDVWYSFVATDTEHRISLSNVSGSTIDMYHSVWEGTCPSLTLVAGSCSDPDNSTVTGLTIGNTYYIRVYSYTSTTGQNSTFDICVGTLVFNGNETCEQPDPVCSGTPIVFQTTVTGLDAEDDIDPGNDYDCLSSSPDPTWYYLEIASAGDLVIDMSASSDIDFAIWGPFADVATAEVNCESYGTPLDCSYSTAAVEQANVTGVTVGQVYVLVVTNYAQSIQTLTISDAPGNTATTDCTIVPLSVEYGSFDGFAKEDHNLIKWSTISEENSDYFIVEKSTDAKVWEFVDIQKAAGNSSQELAYTSFDQSPTRGGIDYYRLKQFDLDGTVEISEIIFVKSGNDIDFTIFPNPAENEVKISSQSEFNKIEMIDLSGKVVQVKDVPKAHNIQLDLSELINGIYFVKVSDLNGNSQMKKLIVQ